METLDFRGFKAIKLRFNNYTSTILYGRGGNVIDFVDTTHNLILLHVPEDRENEEFLKAPQRFGNVILFPPNKIDQGIFTRNNTTYDFNSANIPISHGIIKELPFEIIETASTADFEYIKLCFNSRNSVYFTALNWDFGCILEYTLSDDGLLQQVTFINNGNNPIPFGVGYHTAFRIPFDINSTKNDYRILVSADFQWELDFHSFPTGNRLLPDYEYKKGNILPLTNAIAEHLHSTHISLDNNSNFHGAVISDIRTGTELIYETDSKFNQWMIWNNNASDNYICIEPMSWIINAPNSKLSDTESGFQFLNPNQSWTATNKLWVKS